MILPAAPTAPDGFRFGHEKTEEHIKYRIEWEIWAEARARFDGNNAIGDGHSLTRVDYEDKLKELTDSVATVETLLGRLQFAIQTGFASTPKTMATKLTDAERKVLGKLLAKMLA